MCRAMFLQPVPGGHVTVTSYSGNVLQLVGTAPNTPIVQALVTAIKGHINRYYDNGLYISLLCSKLVLFFNISFCNFSSLLKLIIEVY